MDFSTTTSLGKNEVWYLLALTGNKIQHESTRAQQDLRRLAILCNTFDKNVVLYQKLECELGVENDCEGSPNRGCYEQYAAGSSYDGSDVAEDCDHIDDTNESGDSSDSDSDDPDEWESVEVIDGVLPDTNERRVRWLLPYSSEPLFVPSLYCEIPSNTSIVEDESIYIRDGSSEYKLAWQPPKEPAELNEIYSCIETTANNTVCATKKRSTDILASVQYRIS
jgi:hypothetical protein